LRRSCAIHSRSGPRRVSHRSPSSEPGQPHLAGAERPPPAQHRHSPASILCQVRIEAPIRGDRGERRSDSGLAAVRGEPGMRTNEGPLNDAAASFSSCRMRPAVVETRGW
jgi:hypothetical protein